MTSESLKNNAFTDLNQDIGITEDTINVFDPSVFPIIPEFRIRINSELMLVTSLNGPNFTVTRGIEGTTPTTHVKGDLVELVLTVDSLIKVIKQEYQQSKAIFASATLNGSIYIMELTPPLTIYTPGLKIFFKANITNTGTTSVNVNSLGTVEIKKLVDESLEIGDIQAGQTVGIIYDGTFFQLIADIAQDPSPDKLVRATSLDFTSGVLSDKLNTTQGLTSLIDTTNPSDFKFAINIDTGTPGDFVYSAFGADPNAGSFIKNVDKYSFTLDFWFSFAQEIDPSRAYALGYSFSSNAIVAFGGVPGISINATIEDTDSFILSTETWNSVTNGISSRFAGAGFVIDDNFAYHCGGVNSSFSLINLNDRYINSSNSWQSRTPMLSARQLHSGFQLNNNLFGFVVGGVSTGGFPVGNLEQYSDASNSWVVQTSLPPGRERRAGTAFADPPATKAFYACGFDLGSNNTFLDEYQQSGSVWTSLPDAPLTIKGGSLASNRHLGISTLVQVFGGGPTGSSAYRTNLRYDTSNGSWLTKAQLPQPARYAQASFTG